MVPEMITGSGVHGPRKCLDGEQRRLGVQRIEDGLDQQQVETTVDKAVQSFEVGGDQLVVGDARAPGSLTSGEIDAVRSSARGRRRRSGASPGC